MINKVSCLVLLISMFPSHNFVLSLMLLGLVDYLVGNTCLVPSYVKNEIIM